MQESPAREENKSVLSNVAPEQPENVYAHTSPTPPPLPAEETPQPAPSTDPVQILKAFVEKKEEFGQNFPDGVSLETMEQFKEKAVELI